MGERNGTIVSKQVLNDMIVLFKHESYEAVNHTPYHKPCDSILGL